MEIVRPYGRSMFSPSQVAANKNRSGWAIASRSASYDAGRYFGTAGGTPGVHPALAGFNSPSVHIAGRREVIGMTHVSLFSGIGGLDLAAEAAGIETILQVEREPFPLRVLEKHWPDVPRITDVREVHYDKRWANPTVVSGGFPCQPFSHAGKRRGADDDRYLWPELLRIVEELQPRWVIGENVSGLLSIRGGMEIDDMLASLEARNYEPWILHYPAAGVGAPHKRDRVFIVAHTTQHMRDGSGGTRRRRDEHTDGGQDVADPGGAGRQERDATTVAMREGHDTWSDAQRGRDWTTQPGLGRVVARIPDWMDGEPTGIPRVATGVKNRAARLKALGNAVVPAQAYPIFAAIAEVERDSRRAKRID